MTEPQHSFLANAETLARFVEAFEECELAKESWTHAAHVTVAIVYLRENRSTALGRLRRNIRRFNESVGGVNSDTAGYHETLTVFWLNVLADYLDSSPAVSSFEAAKNAVAFFGSSSKLYKNFYSFDVVNCRKARRGWVMPDIGAFRQVIAAEQGKEG